MIKTVKLKNLKDRNFNWVKPFWVVDVDVNSVDFYLKNWFELMFIAKEKIEKEEKKAEMEKEKKLEMEKEKTKKENKKKEKEKIINEKNEKKKKKFLVENNLDDLKNEIIN